MCRKKFITVLVVFGMTVCGAASSAIVKYNFSQTGFDDGAIVTGMFEGEDLDGDGFLAGNDGIDVIDGSNEITAFNMAFSGNSIVPAFTLGLAELDFMAYELAGSPFSDSSFIAALNPDFSPGQEAFFFGTGNIGTDFCEDDKKCGFVFNVNKGVIEGTSISFELVTVSAVPLPAALWLFGSGLFGLIGMRQIKSFH